MTVVLGLLSACCAGTSDFLGGFASRHAPAVAVTAVSSAVGCLVAVIIAVVDGGSPTLTDLGWGALGGLGAAVGLLSIYSGYARARVSIAAPVAGVGAASLPIVVEIAVGNTSLSNRTAVGIALGLLAIALVSMGRSSGAGSTSQSLLYGLGGAVGLGLLLLCLGQTSEDGGLWPIVPARGVAFAVLASVLAVQRMPFTVPGSVARYVVGIGVLGAAANAFFIAATRVGSVSVAAVLVSMFPAVTVLWARFVFGEVLRAAQVAGLGLALIAVALIAAG